ncbi:MAG: sigma-70 family RNA polymerase sigma factor [Anaerolineae bacterium]|nr:sigma-70 family RNA polymerase sigma factor [Anaerolineae bacterium]
MSEISSSELERIASRDREIVTRVLDGDVDAFAGLIEAYQQPVFNLAYRMLGEANEAEDAAQEAFLRAYRNLHRYDMSRSFKTWLLSITSNYAIDRLRRRRLSWLSIDEPLPPHPALTSDAPDPEGAVIDGERADLVQDLLAKLPDDYRMVVTLRYWYDYSYAEIAEMTDSTESAVKSRLFRARRALAEMLGPSAAANLVPVMEA